VAVKVKLPEMAAGSFARPGVKLRHPRKQLKRRTGWTLDKKYGSNRRQQAARAIHALLAPIESAEQRRRTPLCNRQSSTARN